MTQSFNDSINRRKKRQLTHCSALCLKYEEEPFNFSSVLFKVWWKNRFKCLFLTCSICSFFKNIYTICNPECHTCYSAQQAVMGRCLAQGHLCIAQDVNWHSPTTSPHRTFLVQVGLKPTTFKSPSQVPTDWAIAIVTYPPMCVRDSKKSSS